MSQFSTIPRPGARRVPSKIVDRNGRPMAFFLYPSPRTNLKSYKPRYYLSNDTRSNVGSYDRWELVNYSRQLFAQIPEVGGAIRQKNQYAFGDAWDAHYMGKSTKWGEEAAEFLKELFYPNANLRGQPYDFKTSLRVSGMAMDFDGDDVMLLTEDENHFPKIAFVPAPRISSAQTFNGYSSTTVASRDKYEGDTISGGPFDGAKIFDGIIMDRNMRTIGVRITGDDGTFRDVSIFNADLRYDPEWHDQGRGIPLLARPLLSWLNYQDTREFLQRSLKRAAAMALSFKSRGGDAVETGLPGMEEEDQVMTNPNGKDAAGNPVSSTQIWTQEIEGGEMTFLSTENQEEVTGIQYEVPHQNVQEFVRDIVRGGLYSIGWHYELLNLGETGRAPTRLLADLANQTVWARQSVLYSRWKRAVTYAIAKAMKHGFISQNDVDPYAWEPGFPRQISVDQGNDRQADRDDLKTGMTSKHRIAQKGGYHWTELDRERDAEMRALIDRADALVAYAKGKNRDISFDKAMELLEQRSPNPAAVQVQNPDKDDGGEEDPPPQKPMRK